MALLRYSLWLMPAGSVASKFSEIISRLAKQYDSSNFPPHVTLIGSIEGHEEEIILMTQEVALCIQPFAVKLTSVDYTDYYYKALFVRVEPTLGLLSAYMEARKIFPKTEANYVPHLSLLYGNFSVEVKKQVVEKIGNSCTDGFEVNALHLYLTEGNVDTWREIRVFPLGADSRVV